VKFFRRRPDGASDESAAHAVELFAEPYLFSGIAHMPPGADPIRYAKSTPLRWLPLTRCTVRAEDREWEVEVVIVNLDHPSRLG
jgi:hypothetical protein